MTSAAVAETNAQVATPDLVVDLARFAATIDAARLDAAVVKPSRPTSSIRCPARWRDRPRRRSPKSRTSSEWGGAPQADMFVFGGKFPLSRGLGQWRHVPRGTTTTRMTPRSFMRASGRSRCDRSRTVARQAVGRRSDRGGRGRSRGDLPPRRRHQGRYRRKRLHPRRCSAISARRQPPDGRSA